MQDIERSEKNTVRAMVLLTLLFIAVSFFARECGTRFKQGGTHAPDTVTVVRYDTIWKEIRLFSPTVIQYVPAAPADTGRHISYSDSLEYVQWCDSLRESLNDCASMCLSETVYGDTLIGDTVSVWYRATVSQNVLGAIRLGYRLEQPVTIERTITQYEEVRVPVRSLWLDGGIGYQASYVNSLMGVAGSLGLSYRSGKSGIGVGVRADVGFPGYSVQVTVSKRLVSFR